jgi:hypothetical protein
LAWALEAAWIFAVIFGCGASGWALGFGMGDDATTDNGIGADLLGRWD